MKMMAEAIRVLRRARRLHALRMTAGLSVRNGPFLEVAPNRGHGRLEK
jgi:hypothetical protein